MNSSGILFLPKKIMWFVGTKRSGLSQEKVVVVVEMVMAELKRDKMVDVSYLS